MINEIQRAEELLNGKSFTKEYFFSAYCVLIKYFIGKGLQPNEIRNNILDWENKFGYKRYFDLNDVVVKLYDDKVSAKGDFRVNISEQDIKEITTRFDKINERKIAFAMLCYAKINADKNGCFYMSFLELSNWINVDKSNIHARHFKNIMLFNYIEKVKNNSDKRAFSWNKEKNKKYYKVTKFKIKVDFSNNFDGKWVLEDNDILKLFNDIFNNQT